METNLKENRPGEELILTFLKQTKDGKFAKIEESSLPYIRIQEQREDTFYEEDYYYSMR